MHPQEQNAGHSRSGYSTAQPDDAVPQVIVNTLPAILAVNLPDPSWKHTWHRDTVIPYEVMALQGLTVMARLFYAHIATTYCGYTYPENLSHFAERWEVSNGTVKRAVEELIAAGLMIRHRNEFTALPLPAYTGAPISRPHNEAYTPEQWQALVESYGNKCLCCGAENVPLEKDHVIPRSRGGADRLDNLQPLCRKCNSAKHARSTDFRPEAQK